MNPCQKENKGDNYLWETGYPLLFDSQVTCWLMFLYDHCSKLHIAHIVSMLTCNLVSTLTNSSVQSCCIFVNVFSRSN